MHLVRGVYSEKPDCLFLPKLLSFYGKPTKTVMSLDKKLAKFGLSMLKNPYNDLLFDHIDGLEFFLNFRVQTLSCLPLLQEGTAARHSAVVIIAPALSFDYMYLSLLFYIIKPSININIMFFYSMLA